MTWIYLLGIAALLAAVAAVLGLNPAGARAVSGTRLMSVGRVALLVAAGVLALMAVASILSTRL